MATKVLDFAQYRAQQKRQDTAFRFKGTELAGPEAAARITVHPEGTEQKEQLHRLIDIDVLYPVPEGAKPQVVEALTVLASAISLLEDARQAIAQGKPIPADDSMQHFQMLLPQLFKYRGLGDGYGLIINSIHFAIANQEGRPISSDQMTTIWRVLKELRVRPFLTFDKALDYVADLENSNLQVDPRPVSELLRDDE
jgi:hypothetical protein